MKTTLTFSLVMKRLPVSSVVIVLGSVLASLSFSVSALPEASAAAAADGPESLQREDPLFTQVAKLLASDGATSASFGFSVAVDGATAVVGAPLANAAGVSYAGAAYVFVRDETGWVEQQKLVASDPQGSSEFGWSVAIDGETIAIGATWAYSTAPAGYGAVYVFVRSGTSWTEQAKLAPEIGPSVSIAGDTLLAGSYAHAEDWQVVLPANWAWVFVRSGTTWTEQQLLTGSLNFGMVVSVRDDSALIGGGNDCPVVITRSGDTWTEQQTLLSLDCPDDTYLARGVAINGDTLLVGAHREDIAAVEDAGSAYVMVRNGTTWSEQQKLMAAVAVEDQWFGRSVAIDGDRAVVASRDAAYLFVRSGMTWVEVQELPVGPTNSEQASPVSLSGDVAVVGAPEDDEMGAFAGAAFVFEKRDADLEINLTDSPDPVFTSGTLSYTLSVTNHGPDTAGEVSVVDTLDPLASFSSASGDGWSCGESTGVVTCTRTGLDVGSAPDITIQVQAPAVPGALTNTVTVDASATDPDVSNNTAQENTEVIHGLTPTEARLANGVVINEILVDPDGTTSSYDTDGNGTAQQGDEFVELYNLSDVAVDISGWHLADYSSSVWINWFTFPGVPRTGTTVLGPGNFAVVVVDVQTGGSLPAVTGGNLAFDAGAFDAGWSEVLDDAGDNVVILDPMTYEGVHLVYNGDPPLSPTITRIGPIEDWGSDLDGVSLTRDPSGDVSVVQHHTVSSEYASPGRDHLMYDFGDAPDPTYPTLLANGGASHVIVPGIYIGSTVDGEPDGQPTATADGDDADGTDDEEIPNALVVFTAGSTMQAPITVSGTGLGNTWIDLNQDGDWEDAGEHVVADHPLSTGTQMVSFPIPSDALPGSTFLRIRFSSQAGLGPAGPAPDGEVEDYPAQVNASADLAITKDDGQTTVVPGEQVTYTIVASNTVGPSDVTGATVVDTFPPELTGCSWTCTPTGAAVCATSGTGGINDVVSLPVGGGVTYTASCTLNSAATGSLANTATITAPPGFTDLNPSNDSATDVDSITREADLSATKSNSETRLVEGSTTTYTITVSNSGPSDVVGAQVSDAFPPELSSYSWTCDSSGGGTCTASGAGDLTDTVDLASGTSVEYSATCTVAASSGSCVNTATVTAPAGWTDPSPGNNSATDTDQVLSVAIFSDGFESGDTSKWSSTVP